MFDRRKSHWLIFAAIMILALVASACGGAATETPTEAPMATEEEMMEPTATEEMMEPTATEEMMEPTATEEMMEPTATEEMMEQIGGTVSVLAVWGGDELDSFRAMIAPFEEETGITVEYEGTRDINAVLTTRIEGGNPPDVAGLPGPGQMLTFAEEGVLLPLNDVLDMEAMQAAYDEGFLQLGTVNDQLYGVFIGAAVKSLIWYSPPAFEAAGYTIPNTWEELNALEDQIIADGFTPWCVGLESQAASGWPGTDWIEDIMLRTAGTDTYDQWYMHEIPWTDPAVQNAWEVWGTVVTDPQMVYGGPQNVLATNFGESPFPLFDDPPNCYMHRQASFITSFIAEQFPDLAAGEDYHFFEFPPIDEQYGNPLLTAGDLFGMFNDTPQARALMQYLVTAEAQSIWAERGGFLSANKNVDPAVYPNQLTSQIAEMLSQATSTRFDASDLMPEAVNSAFWTGILDYVSNPDSLPSILESIEATAQDAYE
jgi:alpha-glucoside transport system substrate-binding protein